MFTVQMKCLVGAGASNVAGSLVMGGGGERIEDSCLRRLL